MKETNHGNHHWEGQCENGDCNDISRRFLPHTFAASNGKIGDDEDHIANYVEYHCWTSMHTFFIEVTKNMMIMVVNVIQIWQSKLYWSILGRIEPESPLPWSAH